MDKLKDFKIHVLVYRYDDENIRDIHMKMLKWEGYDAYIFPDNKLQVEYRR